MTCLAGLASAMAASISRGQWSRLYPEQPRRQLSSAAEATRLAPVPSQTGKAPVVLDVTERRLELPGSELAQTHGPDPHLAHP